MNKFFFRRWVVLLTFVSCLSTISASEQLLQSPPSAIQTWLEKTKTKISKKVFANGLTAIHYPIPGSNNVYVGVTYHAGGKNEGPTEHGLAHMVEHMIFKGTEKMSERDLDAIAEKFCIGGVGQGFNASTRYDTTNYYFQTDKNNWPVFVAMLADCMANASFKEHHFASEVKAVAQEIKMRNARPFLCIFDNLGKEVLPLNNPYNHSLGGDLETLLNAHADDLKRFYARHYAPANALVTVTGDCDAEEVFKQIEEQFGSIQNPDFYDNANSTPHPISIDFVQKNVVYYKPTPTPLVCCCWVTPGSSHDNKIAGYALRYALNRRFEEKIQDDQNLVYSISTHAINNDNVGYFLINFEPKETADSFTTQQCINAIKQELENIEHEGITEQELSCFKKSTTIGALELFDEEKSIASTFENSFFRHHNEFEIFDDIKNLEALTQEHIKDFCRHYLRPYTMHTFTAMPIPKEQKEEWEALQAKLDTYEQATLAKKIRESEVEEPRLSDQLPDPKLLSLNYPHPEKKITLSNGLDVYLKYRDASPFVHASLSFKNSEQLGLALASTNQMKVAQFTFDLLSEGSQDYSKQDHQAFFDLLGASWNIGSGGGFFSCLPEDFMLVANRFVHILTKPTYPNNIFLQTQADAIDRIKQAQESAFHLAREALSAHLFKEYSWLKTDEQTIREIQSISYDDLAKTHQQFANPHLMFLTIVGNFDEGTITEQLEETFSSWQSTSNEDIMQNMPSIPNLENPEAISTHKFLPKEQVALVAGRVTTNFDTDDRFCLKILELYLNKCLYEIRERTGVFYSCSGSLSSASYLTKGSSSISTLISIDKVDEAQAAIKQVLQTMCDEGIDAKNLLVAKQNYQVNLAKSFSTNSSLAESYASLVQTNMPWTHFNDCIDRVHRLSCDDVKNVAKKYLDPNSWSFITVGRTHQHART